jgi:hypothetical protein
MRHIITIELYAATNLKNLMQKCNEQVTKSLNIIVSYISYKAICMGKIKTTTVSRIIRIPLAIWNKYNLAEGDYEADWYDAMDEDLERRKIDGFSCIVIHFRKRHES